MLLLPLVVVAVAAGVGQLVTSGIVNQVAQATAQAQELDELHDNLQGVADAGLRYLVDRSDASLTAFRAAEGRVAVDLNGWTAVPERTAEENRIFADLQYTWTIAAPDRAAVGTAGAAPGESALADAAAFWISSDFGSTVGDVAEIQQINTAHLTALQTQRTDAEHTALVTTVAALVLGVAAALILSHRLTRSILPPLRALERGTEAVSTGSYDRSVPEDGYAELGRVGAAFNAMSAQVKARGEEVHSRERRLAALLVNASDGILVVAHDGTLVLATPSFEEAFHPSARGTADISSMVHPDDRERAGRAWARVLAGGLGAGEEVEARLRHRDGTWHHVWCRFTNRLDDPDVEGMVLNLSDVTERHEYEERLSHQALHDPLTGLANRELFRQSLQRAAVAHTASDAPITVLFLDVDDFKQINDSVGHNGGDEALSEVARRLVDAVRPGDTVARLGGDEFGIVLAPASETDALVAAQRVIAAVSHPFITGGKELTPTVSVGIATARPARMQPDALLADADLAMYFAKRAGRGRHAVFTPAMRTALVEQLQLGEELRAAIAAAAIDVHYQPIVDLTTGAVVAAEALARWPHPQRGLIPPATFIPLAEELGIVQDIDAMVLRRACEQGQRWRAMGLTELRLSVNLSGRNLEDVGLVERVARTLEETGFPAAQLELELTEGVSISESARASSLLDALHQLGVKLAIDDFGTGYSALGRLRSLPFDRVKVDKTFVDELNNAEGRSSLLETMVDMAHVLGLEVVAEGVETAAQEEFLRLHGCDFGQGYLFSKPVTADELSAVLAKEAVPAAQAG
ncbi:MAG: putative bifunctional diguanylate cyclase/phosphodiesterase [Candidatus Dormibacteria bacterium]